MQHFKTDQASLFVLDTDIQMVPSSTSAQTLEMSLNVAQTNGEWELINVEVVPATLEIADGHYSQITYHVRCFFYLNLYTFKLNVLYSMMS